MEPIVSPWFIYFLGVISAIQGVVITGAIISALILVVAIIASIFMRVEVEGEYGSESDKRWLGLWRKTRKICIPVFVVFLLVAMFVPSRNTLIAMYVAKFITTDNITKAIETGGNFKDVVKKDIIEIIEAMKGEQEQK